MRPRFPAQKSFGAAQRLKAGAIDLKILIYQNTDIKNVVPMSRRPNEFVDAQDFVEKSRPKYEALVRLVKRICQEAAEELGPGFIKNIYSRADKQDGELKATHKLPRALRKEKEPDNRHFPVSTRRFRLPASAA